MSPTRAVPAPPPLPPAAPASSPIRDLLRLTERPGMLSLAGGLPGSDCFAVELIADATGRALDRTGPTGPTALQYAPTDGLGALRDHLAATAGCDTAEVLVTTGSQQGLDLIARTLCAPGDVVVTEEPSYLGALQAFRLAQVRLEGIAGDADGLDVERLAARLADGLRPRLVYVVADFANPTGATLPVERRRALVALADRYGFWVVEDDPYGRLRFAGASPPSMRADHAPVIRLDSASKILAPGLRVGWVTGPAEITSALARTKQATDLHTSALDQLVVLGALADPRLDAHLVRVRRTYRERADALVTALRIELGDRVEVAPPDGGMFVWARIAGVDTEALLAAALDTGVAYVPGPAFAVDPAAGHHRDRLRLSYTTLRPADIEVATRRLAGVLGARSSSP